MNYYLVTTKCGHVGKNHYIEIIFPVKAETGRDAARIARQFPRVKHHHWDAIKDCQKVSKRLYDRQIEINHNDPYLQVKSKREQNKIKNLIEERMMVDSHQEELLNQNKKSSKPNLRFQRKKYKDNYEDIYYTDLAACL